MEHMRDLSKATQQANSLAVVEYANSTCHSIAWDNTTIVERELDWHLRGIRGAIQIKLYSKNVNRDEW